MHDRPRFAVNARALKSPLTGIGRYVRGLMAEVERDSPFVPEYFCATRWMRSLDQAPAAGTSPGAAGMRRLLRPLRPVVRGVERLHFTAGLRRRDLAFYFEPSYVPFATDLPTVITIHDLSHLRYPQMHPVDRVRELERGLPRAIVKAARILAVSEFTRREVIEVFGVEPGRVVTTPLGVEPRFRPRTHEETIGFLGELSLTHGRYVLVVGTLEPRKNVSAAVEAHARLPSRLRKDYPLVLAGMRGWLSEGLDRRLEAARSRGEVRLLGHVGDDQLPLLYAGATLLSYPSIYEGFGLPPLEAMASGVPVVVSHRASLPEVVDDAGILLEPDDVDALTASMLRIIEDARFASELGARGLARARSFTWQRCAALTIRTWQSVVENA